MGNWTPKYSPEQRAAIEAAYLDRKIRPRTRIQRMAAAGELTLDGNTLDAFQIPYSSVQYITKAAERRRKGYEQSKVAQLPADAYNENIRQRLAAIVDRELAALERQKTASPEKIRGWARLQKDVAALPGKEQKRLPIGPDQDTKSPTNAHSLAAPILTAHRPTLRRITKHTTDTHQEPSLYG